MRRNGRISCSACVMAAVLTLAVVLLAAPDKTLAQGEAAPSLTFPITGGNVEVAFEKGIFTYMGLNFPATKGLVWVVAPICSLRAGDKVDILTGQGYSHIYDEGISATFETMVVATKMNINGVEVKAWQAHDLPKGCVIHKP